MYKNETLNFIVDCFDIIILWYLPIVSSTHVLLCLLKQRTVDVTKVREHTHCATNINSNISPSLKSFATTPSTIFISTLSTPSKPNRSISRRTNPTFLWSPNHIASYSATFDLIVLVLNKVSSKVAPLTPRDGQLPWSAHICGVLSIRGQRRLTGTFHCSDSIKF